MVMPSHEWTRVVVLRSDADGPKDARLNAIFVARDWYAIEHANAWQAMAELCLRERAQAARAAWGLQRMERSALVLLDPLEERELFDFVQSVKKHLPGTSIWSWSGVDLEPLAAGEDHAPIANEPPMPRPMPRPITPAADDDDTARAAAPELQFSPTSAPKPPFLAPSPPEAKTAGMVEEPHAPDGRISREEIDMLLRTESDEQSPMPLGRKRSSGGGGGGL